MAPRVAVISLASDFGCQVQLTNMDHLLDVVGQIDISYWQLAASGHLPAEYDIAVIEGAVTTQEHVDMLRRVRDTAATVMVIGACAVTGGIPGMAAGGDFESRMDVVYGGGRPLPESARISPVPVEAIIEVDYHVPGCPIQPHEFVATLQRALMGLADRPPREPLCAVCKMHENECFYESGTVCLGLVTRSGCDAKCVGLGRPCTGCRGVAEDASLDAAREILEKRNISVELLDEALSLYNTVSEAGR